MKKLLAYGNRKTDAGGHHVHVQHRVRFISRRYSTPVARVKGQFLHGIGARLVPGAAVDADGLQVRRAFGAPIA